jgi:hypothetical protein
MLVRQRAVKLPALNWLNLSASLFHKLLLHTDLQHAASKKISKLERFFRAMRSTPACLSLIQHIALADARSATLLRQRPPLNCKLPHQAL